MPQMPTGGSKPPKVIIKPGTGRGGGTVKGGNTSGPGTGPTSQKNTGVQSGTGKVTTSTVTVGGNAPNPQGTPVGGTSTATGGSSRPPAQPSGKWTQGATGKWQKGATGKWDQGATGKWQQGATGKWQQGGGGGGGGNGGGSTGGGGGGGSTGGTVIRPAGGGHSGTTSGSPTSGSGRIGGGISTDTYGSPASFDSNPDITVGGGGGSTGNPLAGRSAAAKAVQQRTGGTANVSGMSVEEAVFGNKRTRKTRAKATS